MRAEGKRRRGRKKGGEKKKGIFPAFRRSKLDCPRIKVGPCNESYEVHTEFSGLFSDNPD